MAVNSLSVNLIPLTYTSIKFALYVKLNVVWPADAVNVCLVLNVGNDAQVTPVPIDFRYWPFDPVVPSWTPILLENVVTPAILTLSRLVWPSTSKSRRRLKLPLPVNLACSNPLPPTPLNTKFPALVVLPVSFHSRTVFFVLIL